MLVSAQQKPVVRSQTAIHLMEWLKQGTDCLHSDIFDTAKVRKMMITISHHMIIAVNTQAEIILLHEEPFNSKLSEIYAIIANMTLLSLTIISVSITPDLAKKMIQKKMETFKRF
jgi:hypothetical protein